MWLNMTDAQARTVDKASKMMFAAAIKTETADKQDYVKHRRIAFGYLRHTVHPSVTGKIRSAPTFPRVKTTVDVIGLRQTTTNTIYQYNERADKTTTTILAMQTVTACRMHNNETIQDLYNRTRQALDES